MKTRKFTAEQVHYITPKLMGYTLYGLTELGVELLFEKDMVKLFTAEEDFTAINDRIDTLSGMLDLFVEQSRIYEVHNNLDYTIKVSNDTHREANIFYNRLNKKWKHVKGGSLTDRIADYYLFISSIYYSLALLNQYREFDVEGKLMLEFYESPLISLEHLDHEDKSVKILYDVSMVARKGALELMYLV